MDMNNYVGGSISPYGSPENEDSETYEGRPGTYGPVYDEQPGANPRMWQGREIRNDMPISDGPFLDIETNAEGEVVHVTMPGGGDLKITPVFKLPSVEQMRREVETGEFSPESIDLAHEMIRETAQLTFQPGNAESALYDMGADADDWWATQEHFGAPLPDEIESTERLRRNAERKRIEDARLAEADAIINRMHGTPEGTPIPATQAMREYDKRREALRTLRSRQWREEASKSITPATAHFKQIGAEAKKTTKAFKKIAKALPKKPEPGAKLQHRPFLILSTIRDEFTE